MLVAQHNFLNHQNTYKWSSFPNIKTQLRPYTPNLCFVVTERGREGWGGQVKTKQHCVPNLPTVTDPILQNDYLWVSLQLTPLSHITFASFYTQESLPSSGIPLVTLLTIRQTEYLEWGIPTMQWSIVQYIYMWCGSTILGVSTICNDMLRNTVMFNLRATRMYGKYNLQNGHSTIQRVVPTTDHCWNFLSNCDAIFYSNIRKLLLKFLPSSLKTYLFDCLKS